MTPHDWLDHAQARGPVIVNGEPATLIAWTTKRSTPTGPRGRDAARVRYGSNGQSRTVPHAAVSLP